jgi:hypothetical protein
MEEKVKELAILYFAEYIGERLKTLRCFFGFHNLEEHLNGKFKKCKHCLKSWYKDEDGIYYN